MRHPHPEFLLPDYGGSTGNISQIMPTIARLFGVSVQGDSLPSHITQHDVWKGEIHTVILCIIDGLGTSHIQHYLTDYPKLNKVVEGWHCHCITSVCPSTTPVAIPSLITGRHPE